ncbi:uncharacterized protein METZ01_LOCUS259155, partial [marine metagenome]
MITTPIPGTSPFSMAENMLSRVEPLGASAMSRSASLPGAMIPELSPHAFALLPVAKHKAV